MKPIYIFGHKNPDTDTILSSLVLEAIERTMGTYNAKAYRLGNINKETQFVLDYFDVRTPELLEEVNEGDEVMLVDHNEFGQSVKGIEKAKILRVVDHHKIANFETREPLFFISMPVGSTSTVLVEMCESSNIPIDRTTAGLMVSAIISDTLLLKSPTCTSRDKEVAEKLAKIAGIDINTYGLELLKAGTDLKDYTAEELINIDSKPFSRDDLEYQIAQVNTVCIEDVTKNREQIENAIKDFMIENKKDLFILLITDILENNSKIIAIGKQDLVEKAFDVKLVDNMAFLPGVVSRKKQIIPKIESVLKSEE